jgi:hypothetical protein
MLGKIQAIQQDHKAVFIELETTASFKMGEIVNVSKAKKRRTLNQNSMYWAYLTWIIHKNGGGLCDKGHFSTDALHQDIKAWIKDTHEHDFTFDKRFTTTELTTKEFSSFFELVNQELFVDILGVDTSGFWRDQQRFEIYRKYGCDNFKDYLDEQYNDLP